MVCKNCGHDLNMKDDIVYHSYKGANSGEFNYPDGRSIKCWCGCTHPSTIKGMQQDYDICDDIVYKKIER